MEDGLLLTLALAGMTIAFLMASRRRRTSPISLLLEQAHAEFSERKLNDARVCYDRALYLIRQESASDDDREWLATALNGLAYVDFEEQNFDAARLSFQGSVEACGEQHSIIEVSSRAMLVRIAAEPADNSAAVDVQLTSLTATVEDLAPEPALEAAHFLSHFSEPLLEDELAFLVEPIVSITMNVVDRLPADLMRSELVLDVLNIASWSEVIACRWLKAKELSDRGIAISEENATDLTQTLFCLQLASSIDVQLDNLPAAEEKARRAVGGAEAAPATPWSVAQARSQLADVLSNRGELEEALQQQQSAVDLIERFHDEPRANFREYAQEASCLRDLARYEEAFARLRDCQRIHEETPMPAWLFGYFLSVRGLCLLDCRQYEDARGDFREAAAIVRDLFGEGHESFSRARLLELSVDQESGVGDAESACQEVAEILQQETGSDLRLTALVLFAMLDCDLGQLKLAEENAREAIRQYEKRCGGRTQTAALASQTLGRILIEAGRPAEASRCLEEAMEKRESVPGGSRCPYTARILETLALAATAQGQSGQAATFEEHAAAIRKEVDGAAK